MATIDQNAQRLLQVIARSQAELNRNSSGGVTVSTGTAPDIKLPPPQPTLTQDQSIING